jgi:hypothetical protein
MYRESVASGEVKTGMEKSHHLAAALYFGIASIEAYLNQQLRKYLVAKESDSDILKRLRYTRFMQKVREWPSEISGREVSIDEDLIKTLDLYNTLRGEVTHAKASGSEIYDPLLNISSDALVDNVARFIVHLHEARGDRYPYWVFGWNYLSPGRDVHEIMVISDQQFCFSLQAMGFDVPAASYPYSDQWRDAYLTCIVGYKAIKNALDQFNGCEPKSDMYPYQPKLCRRWWATEHQQTCGDVSDEARERIRRENAEIRRRNSSS